MTTRCRLCAFCRLLEIIPTGVSTAWEIAQKLVHQSNWKNEILKMCKFTTARNGLKSQTILTDHVDPVTWHTDRGSHSFQKSLKSQLKVNVTFRLRSFSEVADAGDQKFQWNHNFEVSSIEMTYFSLTAVSERSCVGGITALYGPLRRQFRTHIDKVILSTGEALPGGWTPLQYKLCF